MILWHSSKPFHLLYHLNGLLCISQATICLPDFLRGSHFLSRIVSMWPSCSAHTDTPVEPVWQPVYCWSYGMAVVQYFNLDLNLIQWVGRVNYWWYLSCSMFVQYVSRSVILRSLHSQYVAFIKLLYQECIYLWFFLHTFLLIELEKWCCS